MTLFIPIDKTANFGCPKVPKLSGVHCAAKCTLLCRKSVSPFSFKVYHLTSVFRAKPNLFTFGCTIPGRSTDGRKEAKGVPGILSTCIAQYGGVSSFAVIANLSLSLYFLSFSIYCSLFCVLIIWRGMLAVCHAMLDIKRKRFRMPIAQCFFQCCKPCTYTCSSHFPRCSSLL